MDILYNYCAGLDVHKDSVAVCALWVDEHGECCEDIRTFGTMTCDLLVLSDWLAHRKVTHVAMESTGVYWKPIFNILEGQFNVLLVNARHIKQVPGRKTDVKDCQWIAQLLQHGLLKGSFIPDRRPYSNTVASTAAAFFISTAAEVNVSRAVDRQYAADRDRIGHRAEARGGARRSAGRGRNSAGAQSAYVAHQNATRRQRRSAAVRVGDRQRQM